MFKLFRKEKRAAEKPLADIFKKRYEAFQNLLHANNEVLELMADLEEKSSGDFLFDMAYIEKNVLSSLDKVSSIISSLNIIANGRYSALDKSFRHIKDNIDNLLKQRRAIPASDFVLPLSRITSDSHLVAGGKMANAGELRNSLHLPVPDGFVITSSAFLGFMRHNDLAGRLKEALTKLDIKDMTAVEAASSEFQEMIMKSPLPSELESAIAAAATELGCEKDCRVSVRSSALAEDGHFSFASQYATYLNVRAEEISDYYRRVVSSLFTPRALYYAFSKGFSGEETAMAVGVMRMVPALSGGVMYSQDPTAQKPDVIIINGAWGLAKQVVDGTGRSDQFVVSRDDGTVVEQHINEKDSMIEPCLGQGVETLSVAENMRLKPSLTAEQVRTLASYAVSLEQHFGKPQDIEWTVDKSGKVFLLKAGPLGVFSHETRKALPRRIEGIPLLIEKGVIASRGIGCGPVHLVRSDSDLADFPDGGVLVSRTTSTKFVIIMERASAIVTDIGGSTGHMASLAREYHLPAILDTENATRLLKQGQTVTVDAINCNVYEGRVEELLEYDRGRKDSFRETHLFHLLDQAMQYIVPLRLVDPDSDDFRPEACRTLHDITRFAHEKAMSGMFGMSDTDAMEDEQTITLTAGVPMDAHMIDVGGGIRPGVEKAMPEDILSIPYIYFLKGLQAMRWPEPRAADAKGFLGMMAHAASVTEEQLQQTAIRSFAIVSGNYMNFSIRLGYHFSMVEAFAGDTLNENYIRFFFKGGGAAVDRRLRRVRLISELLEMMDFRVRVTEDVINAVLLKFKRPAIERRLEIMGRMTVFTKQLDMAMYNDDITDWYRDEFVRDHMQLLASEKL